jgi:hypothetical protein
VDRRELQERLLRTMSLRVGDHMAEYVHRQMTEALARPIPVIGADARTGIPVARSVSVQDLGPPAGAGSALL